MPAGLDGLDLVNMISDHSLCAGPGSEMNYRNKSATEIDFRCMISPCPVLEAFVISNVPYLALSAGES